MRNPTSLPRGASVAPRGPRGLRVWLLGACVALGACAEPAPADAATAPQASAVQADATAARTPVPDRPAAPATTSPATASEQPAAHAVHTGHVDGPAASATAVETRKAASRAAVDASLPRMQVHKSPTCGCCSLWVDHMREAGFAVEVHDTHDLAAVKSRLGVPADAQSCHTAEVGGLVVEGHVPASDIKRALAQGGTRALVLPGMPVNSPGMEVPGINAPPYTVERITSDGTREPFATHGESARGR